MGIATRESAPQVESAEMFEGRYTPVDDYVIGFERYTADQNVAALFAGLPDDACQCPHWGVVLSGKVQFRYTDGSVETAEGGQAYYARPGHIPTLFAGTEVVEFSPAADLQKTMEVVFGNIAAMQEAGA
jgi:hypothetical protein